MGLFHLPSVPGLQGHFPSLSKAPSNSTYTQGALSISKSDPGTLKSFLSDQGSKGKFKSKQRHLEHLSLTEEDMTSMSSKPSKDPSASSLLLSAEHLTSPPGCPVQSSSKQWCLGTSLSSQGSLGCSLSAPGTPCCFQNAQGAREFLFSWGSFSPLLSYSGHLSLLPGDQEVSSLE